MITDYCKYLLDHISHKSKNRAQCRHNSYNRTYHYCNDLLDHWHSCYDDISNSLDYWHDIRNDLRYTAHNRTNYLPYYRGYLLYR